MASPRLLYLDGMRGVAALLVVCNHAIIAVDSALQSGQLPDSRNGWDIWLSGTPFFPFDNTGNLAVCMFFILSGDVLTQSYLNTRHSWPALVAKRYVRLFIPMLAGCLAAWALLALHMMGNTHAGQLTHAGWLTAQFQQTPDFLAALWEPVRLLAFQHVPISETYDSSLWTMPIEAAGSLILITLFSLCRHRRALAGLVLAALAVGLHGGYLCLFCLGGLWRLAGVQRAILCRWRRIMPLLLAGLWLGTMPYSPARWGIYNHMADATARWLTKGGIWAFSAPGAFHAAGAVLIMATLGLAPRLQQVLAQPWACYLGRISFVMYIFHVPCLMVTECGVLLLAHRFGVPDSLAACFAIPTGIATGLAAGAAFSPWIEQYALKAAAKSARAVDYAVQKLPV